MPSGTWLVHKIRSPGAASRRRTARSAAESTTCSQLSRMSVVSARRSRSARAVSPPVTFNAAITASTTSSVVIAISNRASHTPPDALQGAAGGDRHGRLADTAHTDDLDQPPGGEQLGQVGDDPVATDEFGRYRRQVADRHGSLGRVGRRAHGGERSVVGEDLVLESLQWRSRVETQLVGQQAPYSLVCGQRVSLAPTPVQALSSTAARGSPGTGWRPRPLPTRRPHPWRRPAAIGTRTTSRGAATGLLPIVPGAE